VDLVPITDILQATDRLEKDIDTAGGKRALELVRETVLNLRQPGVDQAVAVARESIDQEVSISKLVAKKLEDAGWEVEIEAQLGSGLPRPDLLARKNNRLLVAEVKAGRGSLDSSLPEQLEVLSSDVADAKPDDEVQPILILGAGAGKPTRIEKALAQRDIRVVRVSTETGNVTGLPD
jgi:hypothetical protein